MVGGVANRSRGMHSTSKRTLCPCSLAGPADMPVAQSRNTANPLSSDTVTGVLPSTKVGGSFTGRTRMEKRPRATAPAASVAVMITSASPKASGAGWKWKVRWGPDPVSLGGVAKRASGTACIDTVTSCASSCGPAEMLNTWPSMCCSATSSSTLRSPATARVGGSFTPETSTVIDCVTLRSLPPFRDPPESTSVSWRVAMPDRSGAMGRTRSPFSAISGGLEKSGAPDVTTSNRTDCPLSFGGPGDTSVTAADTRTTPGSSSRRTMLSLTRKVGGSFTGRILSTAEAGWLAEAPPAVSPPLSRRITVSNTSPKASGAGVKVNVPDGETAGGTENRAETWSGLPPRDATVPRDTSKATCCKDSYGFPGDIRTAHPAKTAPPLSSSTSTVPLLISNCGGSFTGVMVMGIRATVVSTPPLALPPSSWMVTVNTASPVASGAGVSLKVPLDMEPAAVRSRSTGPLKSSGRSTDTSTAVRSCAASSAGPGSSCSTKCWTTDSPLSSATRSALGETRKLGGSFTGTISITKGTQVVSSPPPLSLAHSCAAARPERLAAGVKESWPAPST
eukprot:Sspe_Gene.47092::Locus_23767_Transcript_1_1_Confidence_1.000_Length_3036::g.47092::m.47092